MKHLLYFAGHKMVVLRWQANAFTGMAEFEPDGKGFAAFARLLQAEVKNPVKLLVDIIEEDFRFDTAPHIIGTDRAELHKRLINKYFRVHPHVYLEVQGRQNKGRRDDIVLLSALTNSKLFEPWLEILHKHKVPLEGIYSLPLVGEALIKMLGAQNENALIISQQVPSSIRQSFYSKGKLKLSRLAPGGDDTITHLEALREETERTVRYLENQQYIDANRKLDVYVIVASTDHAEYSRQLQSDTQKEFHILDKDRLAFDLGVKSATPTPYSFWLFAHLLLADKHRKHHYGTAQDRRYYFHYLARKGMYAAAAVIFAISTLWGVTLLAEGLIKSLQKPHIIEETAQYNRLYDEIISDIAKLNLKVEDVRDVVDAADRIQQRFNITPLDYMQRVSKVLQNHPVIEVRNVKWIQTTDSGHSFGEKKAPLDARMLRMVQAGRKTVQYEKALIEATIADFKGNPRIAIEEVNRFVDELGKIHSDGTVEIIKLPFDVDPASRTVGVGLQDNARTPLKADFVFVMLKETEIQ